MICGIRANKPSFRAVEFGPGFNVVMADRTTTSTEKDSRNGLGKSTLVEIIHFVLGGSAKALSPLDGWTFSVDMRVGGRDITVTRSVGDPKRLEIAGPVAEWEIGKKTSMGRLVTDADWNEHLGLMMFGLPPRASLGKWAPSFRSLIPYFVRRGVDAFSTPFEHFRKQLEWDKQVANAWLLGLAWEDAQAWERLREKARGLKSLKDAAKSGVVPGLTGTVGELEAERVRLDERSRAEDEALRTFKVHPRYREIEVQASRLTGEIHELANQNVMDRDLIAYYRRSLAEIVEPSADQLLSVYDEAGVLFGELVRKRLDDVRDFHAKLIANRRDFLGAEVERIEVSLRLRDAQIGALTLERAAHMTILQESGALEEYTRLQRAHLATTTAIKDLETRIANLKQVDVGQSALKVEKEQLYQRARQDYEDREASRRRAISLFNAHSQALYAEPGRLIIEVTHAGFKFDVDIERARSDGVGHMKVFCYDLTLAQLWARKPQNPGFLIHDSVIFDGVDERQVAAALHRAAMCAATDGFQYICTINSDVVPYSHFPSDFDFDANIVLRLTDATPEGGLLGVRF